LPGVPDNLTYSKARGLFWVALFAPRNAALDVTAGLPYLRRVIWRLPTWVQPKPARHAYVLGINEQGKIVENLQDPRPESFSAVTSVRERGGVLWIGSLSRDALGRIPAP